MSQTTEKLSKPLIPRAVYYPLLILIQSSRMSSFTSLLQHQATGPLTPASMAGLL